MRRPFALRFRLSLFLLPFLLLSGCGPFWVNPYVTVNDSPLNWVSIHYYSMRSAPIRRIGVEIRGTGLVEVRKGTSDLVSDDFAKRYSDANWGDIRTHRLQIPPAHVKDIFQNLVNYGLLDREKTGKKSKRDKFDRFVAVKANVNNQAYSETVNIFEVDPELAEQLVDVVREFENPAR